MSKQRNVLLIITDQQRSDTLGFRSETPCRTPNMDRLAAQGVSFDDAITPCPLCLPARTALFTDRYPHQTHTLDNDDSLEENPSLLTKMREAGYQIDYAGKWHMGEENIHRWTDRHAGDQTSVYSQWCLDRGIPDGWAFNDMSVRTHRTPHMSTPASAINPIRPEETNDAWIADHAIQFLETRQKDRPFFLTCSFNGPHPPFKIPEPYYSMYDPDEIPEPPNFRPNAGEPECYANSFYRALWRDYGKDWSAWRKSVAVYWGFVTLIDAQIGRLLKALAKEGVEDDTMIVFTSDHGEMLGQHGLWHKMVAYEEALRVPLIIREPGSARSGVRSRMPASLIDIAPTILTACGIESPGEFEGVDLLSTMNDGRKRGRDRFLFSEHKPLGDWHGAMDWRMVLRDRGKYIWNRGDLNEYYDLKNDPREMDNRINDPASENVICEFQKALHEWMIRTNDPLLPEFQQETERRPS